NIPFTNNIAESSFRMFKVKQRVSSRFYAQSSIDAHLSIRAFINSKRNTNLFTAFNNLFQ
ncbi:MAG: hypothetical protein LBM99_02350, partial [Bacillales bacterium]|nr:hypothetical protein [Bacillales bacterium]